MILYYFFRTVEFILFLLPYPLRKGFFTGLAKLAHRIDKRHRRVVRQNLLFAFKDTIDEAKIDEITRYCYRNLMLNFLQVCENRRMQTARLKEMVTFENLEIVQTARAEGRPIIFISAHYGNWELGAAAAAALIMPTTSIHKKLNNPWFDQYLRDSREHLQMHMAEKTGAVKTLMKALKNHEAVSLLVDQNINPRESIVVDFFGKRVTQTSAPAFLARKFDAVVIPAFIHTRDEKHYTVRFETPIPTPKTHDAQADVLIATQRQSDAVEHAIRTEPKFWFWCHKRWKTLHKELYD